MPTSLVDEEGLDGEGQGELPSHCDVAILKAPKKWPNADRDELARVTKVDEDQTAPA